MAKEAHVEEASQRELRSPEPALQEPVCMGKVLRSPAAAHFHDRHFVALFDQTVRTDASAKTGADDDEVKIELAVGSQTDLLRY
jgi:hypothetical protein